MSHQRSHAAQSIAFTAPGDVRAAIKRLGRREDVQYSPDGKRLAVLGLVTNRLLIVDVETSLVADQPHIALTGFLELDSATFSQPHGVAWADDQTLIIGNRRSNISVVALPHDRPAAFPVEIEPLCVIGADGMDLVTTPGSLSLRPVGMGLIELLVCNNYVDHVTRHLIDQRDGYKVLASEILIDEGISVPDGVAQSPSGHWIAISNHTFRNVFLFRNDGRLSGASKPEGILTGLSYPHGLKFSGDGKALLVADAGAPFVHIFRADDGDWSGGRTPSGTIQTLSDAIFRRGNHSPLEGGPKGIDLTHDNRVMVTICEEQPLAFFDMRGLLPSIDPPPLRTGDARESAGEADRARETMVRYLSSARARAQHEAEAIRRAGEFERQALITRQLEIRALVGSRSWRLTTPLRWLNARVQRMKHRR